MEKCGSSQDKSLPPEASVEQILQVKRACEWDKAPLGESAQYHAKHLWKIGATGLRTAVSDHIDQGRKIFQKYDPDDQTKLLNNHLHANVTIMDGKNVYVEMVLMQGVAIILNAHEHTTIQRLPQ